MLNLLSSCFFRLRKSVVFWVAEITSIVFGVFMAINMKIDTEMNEFSNVLDDGLFSEIAFMGILLAVFVTLFLGAEYSDGTIRNKVSAGCSRVHIYVSYLCVSCMAAAIFYVSYMIFYLLVGFPLLGGLHLSIATVFLNMLSGLFLAWSYVSIYSLAAILNSNKAVVAVSCVILSFALLFLGITIRLKLSEPVTFDASYYSEGSGEAREEEAEPEETPYYVKGIQREIYVFLNEFLPGGQSVELSGMTEEISFSWHYPAYSILMVLLTSCTGVILFKKKDLK